MTIQTPVATLTEAILLAALRDCYHPQLPCNIVDLGLVESIVIAPDLNAPGAGIPGVPQRHSVQVALTLPPSEDSGETAAQLTAQIAAQIENRLSAFEAVHRTTVHLLTEPAWTPARISPAGYARLNRLLPATQSPNALIQIQTRR